MKKKQTFMLFARSARRRRTSSVSTLLISTLAAAAATLTGAGAATPTPSSGSFGGGNGGSGWDADDDGSWSLRNLVTRFTGLPAVASLCAVSNCQRSKPLPPRPGGRYAEFGPLQTRLVYLDATATRGYGFPGALVACPVVPVGGGDVVGAVKDDGEGRSSSSLSFNIVDIFGFASSQPNKQKTKKHSALFPGVAWSYGGNGNCDGTGGFADAADGYPGLYGEDRGYWLPELLEHMASHGVVTVCPYLAGVPDAGGAQASVNAALMLADLQPCVDDTNKGGAKVSRDALGVAGYSLGAGRAVRGAARDTVRNLSFSPFPPSPHTSAGACSLSPPEPK